MKSNNHDIELLLKRALSSAEMPDDELIQKTKSKLAQEKPVLKITSFKFSFRTVAATIILLLFLTTTAYAVWALLKPSEVTEEFEDYALSEAFESEDALIINQSIKSGDFIFTLLGVVSGKDITDMPSCSDGILQTDRTYAVVAIQKADGTPMPGPQDSEYLEMDFLATPFVKGIEPFKLNIFMMDGACTWNVIDGIQYRLVECDNVEMFADRGLYFAIRFEDDSVLTAFIYNEETGQITENPNYLPAFIYNEQTGQITANPDYNGCAVFDLPIDPKKADPIKAQQYLNGLLP